MIATRKRGHIHHNDMISKLNSRRKMKSYKKNEEEVFKILFNAGDYKILIQSIQYMNYSPEEQETLYKFIYFYYSWDNTNYKRVIPVTLETVPTIIEPLLEQYHKNVEGWNELERYNREFHIVIDLINKAKRCSLNLRHTESILLLYRACEMIAQLRLKEMYKLDSRKVEIHRLKKLNVDEKLIKDLSNDGKFYYVSLSLRKQLELLCELDDSIGNYYYLHRGDFKNLINLRHQSLLTHGVNRIKNLKNKGYDRHTRNLARLFDRDAPRLIQLTEFPKYEV